MEKKLFIGIILLSNILNAQTIYYGKNNKGNMELLNDSMYTVRFYTEFGIDHIYQYPDTGYYKKNGDTIFLLSKPRNSFEVIVPEQQQISKNTGYPILTKKYSFNDRKKEYELVYESWYEIFDTLNQQIVYNDFYVSKDCILVINIGGSYSFRLKWKLDATFFFTLKLLDQKFIRPVFLDEFPLIIKGNKLIPINKEKNEQCWVDNGFYFPIMRKSKKEKEFKTIARWSIGLQGLPCSICAPTW